MPHVHRSSTRGGWLRAFVLGANDGMVSTASLLVGVAAAGASRGAVGTAGLTGLVGGALSMAAGEYVSVSSQRDAEEADRALEVEGHQRFPDAEFNELVTIYQRRGLDRELAQRVVSRFHEVDPVGAHLRDEIGIDPENPAKPLEAALASAGAFVAGALLPLTAMLFSGNSIRVLVCAVVTLLGLTVLGAIAARLGGAAPRRAAVRVMFWGALALAFTSAIGALFGVAT